jgi:hypothetical protein
MVQQWQGSFWAIYISLTEAQFISSSLFYCMTTSKYLKSRIVKQKYLILPSSSIGGGAMKITTADGHFFWYPQKSWTNINFSN